MEESGRIYRGVAYVYMDQREIGKTELEEKEEEGKERRRKQSE